MENLNLYQDIAKRTDGDIYVGVVGPVRTGKSTFIKKFMNLLVIPNIENEYKKLADSYKAKVEEVKTYIAKDALAEDIKVEKAMQLVRDNAKVKK